MSKSSRRWLREHHEDEYVTRAKKEGWRSRAVYKLMELDQKYHLLQPGMTVVDLGAAPGGWSQYAAHRVQTQGTVLALDLLEVPAIAGVDIIQGDFREEAVLNQLLEVTKNSQVDLVLSDMAPNMSGMRAVDAPRAMYLAELALDFVDRVLKPNGCMTIKLFHGEGFDAYVKEARNRFREVYIKKPKASRPRSKEVYLVARKMRIV